MKIFFAYSGTNGMNSGKFLVDDNSSLYGLAPNETFPLRVNPDKPSQFYSEEAHSLSQTIRQTIVVIGIVFAVVVFVIVFLGRK